MYRTAIEDLKKWKESAGRKPLVVKGARQVGKTWLVQHFGEEFYDEVAYINFDRDELAKDIFALDYDVERIVARLAVHAHAKIVPGKTLIFLDEIQECPRALEALKYFCEEGEQYHVVVAGSLLGVALHEDESFPVGKVDFLTIYPLNFGEFLTAVSEEGLADSLAKRDFDVLEPFHAKSLEYYKAYLIIGGMPEVVQRYVNNRDFAECREMQQGILDAYEQDFSKHAPVSEVPRIREIFNTVPQVLAKENKKFMFGAIKPSARSREYEAALLWLIGAGLVMKVMRTNKIALPLDAYSDNDAFKLFMVDVGLLGCKAGLRPETIFAEDEFLEEFKGAMAEQFVFQEMVAHGVKPYYYSKDDSRTELDFIVDTAEGPTPIEVKSGRALTSKSLTGLMVENQKIRRAVKFSTLWHKENQRITNLPIYMAGLLNS